MKTNSDEQPPETIDVLFRGLAKLFKEHEETLIDEQIKYPIEVEVVTKLNVGKQLRHGRGVGTWVAVRPCDPALDNKTYLGILMGDMPIGNMTTYTPSKKVLAVIIKDNPAIYVPDLKRLIYGIESWWSPIESPDDLKKITDQDIQNVWYVKALNELYANPANKDSVP